MNETILPFFLFVFLTAILMIPAVPLRWSLVAYLLLAHLNLSQSSFTFPISPNAIYAISLIVFPLMLLYRVGLAAWPIIIKTWGGRLWLLFVLYVSVASLWSPFHSAAIKQLGFFFIYTITLFIFVTVGRKEKKAIYDIILRVLFLSIGLAAVQSFVLDSQYGLIDDQFTSYTSQQSFGLYLVLTFVLITSFGYSQPDQTKLNFIAIPLILICILLNGSRIAFISISILCGIWLLMWCLQDLSYGRFLICLTVVNLGLLLFLFNLFTPITRQFNWFELTKNNRSLQILATLDKKYSLKDIGTSEFRLSMYQTIFQRVEKNSDINTITGNGTSSIGSLVTEGYIYYRNFNDSNIDANRIAHNEYLRAFYEWGVIGAVLFFCFLLVLVTSSFQLMKRKPTAENVMLWAGLLIILLYMMVENIFAAAGSPGGLAISLLLAQVICINLPEAPAWHGLTIKPSFNQIKLF